MKYTLIYLNDNLYSKYVIKFQYDHVIVVFIINIYDLMK